MKVITVDESRYLEQKADEGGLTYAQMMENAGRQTAEAVRLRLPVKDKRIVVLTGPGSNGGDGLVAAHYLREMGARVTCYIWTRDVAADANYQRVERESVSIVWARDDVGFQALRGLVGAADVVLDALLGVGISRPIGGSLKELLETVKATVSAAPRAGLMESIPHGRGQPRPMVVAVDCPTGLHCDGGTLDPAALFADVTVTFAHPKRGLLRFPGAEAVGELIVADIGIAPELASRVRLEMATPQCIRAWLPGRPRGAHKGTFGRALIVSGSVNYTGAAVLAGTAATRVGTGLVTMGLPAPIQPVVAAQLKEATYLLLPHDLGVLSSASADVLRDSMGEYEALLVGPGLTQEPETIAFVYELLGLERPERKGRIGFVPGSEAAGSQRPDLPRLVLDADALNALARADHWWTTLPPQTILTPHPGEMARLMGSGERVQDVQADREGTCSRMAQAWGAVVVLKGAFTVVASPDGCEMVIPFANSGLATAGSGDVLAGAIVGLLAQGMDAFEAAVAGAYVHGLAGEVVRSEFGPMGMVAGDLLTALPRALSLIRHS